MLNGTGDVRHEFMCSVRLKDEMEQLLKLSFSMSDQLLYSVLTHINFGSLGPGYYFRFPLVRSRSIGS